MQTKTKAAKSTKITAATGIHKGDRPYQQDQVLFLTHARVNGCAVGVVADGMGGRSGGRKASDQVMMTVKQLFERFAPGEDDSLATLRQMALEAHLVIKLTALSSEQEPHSTIGVFMINPTGECHWVTAGDTRLYHFRRDKLVTRSIDHSHVQGMVDRGEIASHEADSHPLSNILTSCLGIELDPALATHSIAQLEPGDILLACSDGLWHYFSNTELGLVLSSLAAREAAEFLVKKARERAHGGGDNLSLVIVKMEQDDTSEA